MNAIETTASDTSSEHPAQAPVSIAAITLRVRDLAAVEGFYRTVIGLDRIDRADDRVSLGAGGDAFLHLLHDPAAHPDDATRAGLFHTAFLLPARADLARWLAHAGAAGTPIEGASDHDVSEAIYLSDPEGNGVEVYADRPRARWHWQDGQVGMGTRRLATDDLLRLAAGSAWAGAPAGTRIGHVHLRVGEVERAVEFYRDRLGLDLVRRLPAAAFLSTGGYHHHIATNCWQSRGAGPRDPGSAGLDAVTLAVRDGALPGLGTPLADPWGTTIRLARI